MVNLEPLLTAPLAIRLHVLTVVPAFALGTWLLFFSTKGTARHRLVGKVYLSLMAATAVAALCIRSFSSASLDLGPFRLGLLHLFVPLTAHGVYGAPGTSPVTARRCAASTSAASSSPALLAFAPGRVMYRMFFG